MTVKASLSDDSGEVASAKGDASVGDIATLLLKVI